MHTKLGSLSKAQVTEACSGMSSIVETQLARRLGSNFAGPKSLNWNRIGWELV